MNAMKPKADPIVTPDFLKPFISGTIETFKTQVGVDVAGKKPFIQEKGAPSQIDIAGVINLVSDSFTGTIAICFSKEIFLKIYEVMLDENHSEIDEETMDAAGELLNIIFGQAKTQLVAQGHTVKMAIPTVMVGEKLKVHFKSRVKAITLPFSLKFGDFHMEIVIEE